MQDRVSHYVHRAQELREVARGMKDPLARKMIREIAKEYLALAKGLKLAEDNEFAPPHS